VSIFLYLISVTVVQHWENNPRSSSELNVGTELTQASHWRSWERNLAGGRLWSRAAFIPVSVKAALCYISDWDFCLFSSTTYFNSFVI